MTPLALSQILIERVGQEMRLRNYSPRTITTYQSCLRAWARHIAPVLPRDVDSEAIRAWLLDLVATGVSRATLDQHVSALRFLYVELYDRYQKWLQNVEKLELPPSDPLGKTVQFVLKHWDALTLFVDEPSLPLDTNEAEREFQRHAKLRYASLFAGSVEGARRWATLFSVVRTAQKCGVDVEAYLTWLFDHMGTHREKRNRSPAELTPMAYRELVSGSRQAA